MAEIMICPRCIYIRSQDRYTQFVEGDVIFAKITPCMENGKAAIVKEAINGIAYGSTEFFVLRPYGVDVSLTRIFQYCTFYGSFRNQAKHVMNGAVWTSARTKGLDRGTILFPSTYTRTASYS